MEDAYRISQLVAEARQQAGAILKGHKIGLTSRPMQEAAGINEPDYGVLLDDLFVAEGSVIPTDRLFQPLAEAELAFVLREPLAGPSVNAADVIRATDFVLPCIEVVDRRFTSAACSSTPSPTTRRPASSCWAATRSASGTSTSGPSA